MNEATRDVPWRPADVGWAVLFVAVVIGLTLGLTRALAFLRPGPVAGLIVLSLSLVLSESSIGVAVWLFGVRKYGASWSKLGFRPASFSTLILSGAVLFFGLLVNVLYAVGIRALGLESLLPPQVLPAFTTELPMLAVVAVLAAVIAPVVEEAFFRGFVFPALRQRLGTVVAALGSAALFSLAHAQPGVVVPVFVLGLALVWLFARTGSLLPCVLVHSSYNLLGVVAGIAQQGGG